jgi:enoyl-CoA hydratase/carnithine racemase
MSSAADSSVAAMSWFDLTAFAAGEQVRDPSRGFAGSVERPSAKPVIAAVEGWALGGGFEIVHRWLRPLGLATSASY